MMKSGLRLFYPFVCLLMAEITYSQNTSIAPGNEVIYHIFLRSFADADGDGHGDLKGLQSKLNYLQDLGITSVLLTPLYSSPYYHNYFSDDFEKIDPEFGTMQDY
jgi:alpha-amylase